MAHNFNVIEPITIFFGQFIAAGTTSTSSVIKLKDLRAIGFFSLDFRVFGSGALTLEYLLSNDGGTPFLTSTSTIMTGLTSTSGPDNNGLDLIPFTPTTAIDMTIRATETSGASSATITMTMAVQ